MKCMKSIQFYAIYNLKISNRQFSLFVKKMASLIEKNDKLKICFCMESSCYLIFANNQKLLKRVTQVNIDLMYSTSFIACVISCLKFFVLNNLVNDRFKSNKIMRSENWKLDENKRKKHI